MITSHGGTPDSAAARSALYTTFMEQTGVALTALEKRPDLLAPHIDPRKFLPALRQTATNLYKPDILSDGTIYTATPADPNKQGLTPANDPARQDYGLVIPILNIAEELTLDSSAVDQTSDRQRLGRYGQRGRRVATTMFGAVRIDHPSFTVGVDNPHEAVVQHHNQEVPVEGIHESILLPFLSRPIVVLTPSLEALSPAEIGVLGVRVATEMHDIQAERTPFPKETSRLLQVLTRRALRANFAAYAAMKALGVDPETGPFSSGIFKLEQLRDWETAEGMPFLPRGRLIRTALTMPQWRPSADRLLGSKGTSITLPLPGDAVGDTGTHFEKPGTPPGYTSEGKKIISGEDGNPIL